MAWKAATSRVLPPGFGHQTLTVTVMATIHCLLECPFVPHHGKVLLATTMKSQLMKNYLFQTRLGPERVASSFEVSTGSNSITATIFTVATDTDASMGTSCSTPPGVSSSISATPLCSLSFATMAIVVASIVEDIGSYNLGETWSELDARQQLSLDASVGISCNTLPGAYCSTLATLWCSHDAAGFASALAPANNAIEPSGTLRATC